MRFILILFLFYCCSAPKNSNKEWVSSKSSDSTLIDVLYIDSSVVIENTYLHGKFKMGILYDKYNNSRFAIVDTNLSKANGLGGFKRKTKDSLFLYFWIPMTRYSDYYNIYYKVDDVIVDSFCTKDNPIWITKYSIKDIKDFRFGKTVPGYFHVFNKSNNISFKDTLCFQLE